jgi:hypothetical protein
MSKNMQRVLTKRKQVRSAYLMDQRDRDLMTAAAYKLGESKSEFLRRAIRERSLKTLGGPDQKVSQQ